MILFVVLVFLFQDFTAGLERLPRLPVPPLKPRAFSREEEPRDKGRVAERAFCFAVPTECLVCFLHFGQYLLVSFGSFIFIRMQPSLTRWLYLAWLALC